ncbi:methyltransferase family protein [Candidatus Thioglobus sp.]|uniref:methyltransferase family protein n=1 Tax=Candidatus Thioglobus sp. TaxID=2026721 RepID=UPI003D11DBCD
MMIYVVIQFFAILFLVVNAQIEKFDIFSAVLLTFSLIIGITALINMKLANLNILPTFKDGHQLVTTGLYRYIRHPMYTSVIFLCFSLLLTNLSIINQLVMLILIIDLWLKSSFEERLLLAQFDDYQNYQKSTARFLPFI